MTSEPGLCGALALDATKSWPWTSDEWPALYVFGYRHQRLMPLVDLGRRAMATGDAAVKQRAYELLKPNHDAWRATFANWEPTVKERQRPI